MISAGRSINIRLLRGLLTVALASLAIPIASQESPAPPAYFLLSEASVLQEDSADWAEALTLAAQAHAKHVDGHTWVTYRKLTGGPNETVRFFFPLNRMGDLDAWKSNRQILTETLGADRARAVLADLDLAEDADERVLSYSDKLSRPWPNFQAPKYAWVEEVRVTDGKMVEYAALIARVVRAFNEQGSEGYWVVYGNAIGGDNTVLTWMYGFDQFAEIDAWDSRLATLAKGMAEGEAARLMAAIDAITETTTSLWQMEPALSQLEGE